LDVWYLIDAKTTNGTVTLRFCNASGKEVKEVKDSEYEPYFLAPYPLSEKDAYTIDRIVGKVSQIQKRDLFTDEVKTLSKVSVKNPENIEKFSKMFENTWEGEIGFARGYIYDHGLVFGAQYSFKESQFNAFLNIQEETKQEFENIFGETKKTDQKKYDMLEYWFNLLQQPVPQVMPEILGIKEVDAKRYYVAFMLSRIANIPVSEAYSSRHVSDWIKSIIYRYLRENGILIPNSKELRRGRELKHSVTGALTIAPKSGIYFNTVVTDFESLYPSVIDSYNLSYETVNCEHEECKNNKISEVDHYICIKRRGFYAVLFGALKDLRIHWFKPHSKDQRRSEEEMQSAEAIAKLLKLLTVSSYGVTIRIHGLASTPLAESITGYGRYILQTAWNMAEDHGLHPTYGDTDSLFLDNPSEEEVKWLTKTVKERLRLDLAVEKKYSVCVLPKAKKAYFGILQDGTPDIKGLTVIKSNSPRFFQKVFQNCVKELGQVKNMEEYKTAEKRIVEVAQEAEKTLRQRKIPLEDLQYFVELYFDPKEKLVLDEAMHQPYQCAVQLMDSGREVNKRDTVSFIKVKPFMYKGKKFTVKPSDFVKSPAEINVDDYIRNLRTALGQTFEPMNISFEAEKDMKLSEWFSQK
jgi:DNA polymerase elongation subunit (family B)